MNRKQIKQEYQKIDFELFVNKPKTMPYSSEDVKRRELLLFAQVHLANILDAKAKRHKRAEKFETEMYNAIMDIYYYLGEK
jgi:hypothetical protein